MSTLNYIMRRGTVAQFERSPNKFGEGNPVETNCILITDTAELVYKSGERFSGTRLCHVDSPQYQNYGVLKECEPIRCFGDRVRIRMGQWVYQFHAPHPIIMRSAEFKTVI